MVYYPPSFVINAPGLPKRECFDQQTEADAMRHSWSAIVCRPEGQGAHSIFIAAPLCIMYRCGVLCSLWPGSGGTSLTRPWSRRGRSTMYGEAGDVDLQCGGEGGGSGGGAGGVIGGGGDGGEGGVGGGEGGGGDGGMGAIGGLVGLGAAERAEVVEGRVGRVVMEAAGWEAAGRVEGVKEAMEAVATEAAMEAAPEGAVEVGLAMEVVGRVEAAKEKEGMAAAREAAARAAVVMDGEAGAAGWADPEAAEVEEAYVAVQQREGRSRCSRCRNRSLNTRRLARRRRKCYCLQNACKCLCRGLAAARAQERAAGEGKGDGGGEYVQSVPPQELPEQ